MGSKAQSPKKPGPMGPSGMERDEDEERRTKVRLMPEFGKGPPPRSRPPKRTSHKDLSETAQGSRLIAGSPGCFTQDMISARETHCQGQEPERCGDGGPPRDSGARGVRLQPPGRLSHLDRQDGPGNSPRRGTITGDWAPGLPTTQGAYMDHIYPTNTCPTAQGKARRLKIEGEKEADQSPLEPYFGTRDRSSRGRTTGLPGPSYFRPEGMTIR